MTDIQFAKENMGEYFQYKGHKVRVIGYDATGTFESVIVDYHGGWELKIADSSDIICESLCKTGRCYYVKQEDLRCL